MAIMQLFARWLAFSFFLAPPLPHRLDGGVELVAGQELQVTFHIWLDMYYAIVYICGNLIFEGYERRIDSCAKPHP